MKLETHLIKEDILVSLTTDYDLSNAILYKLCEENFTHDKADKILAKTVIIGRTYAVALDRGKDKGRTKCQIEKKKLINDDFYQFVVVPLFKKLAIDDMLLKLRTCKNLEEKAKEILSLFNYLMNKLVCLNGEHKRSFTSKYLHFHLPNLFFIYDSRAKQALNKIVSGKLEKENMTNKQDDQYVNFFINHYFYRRKSRSNSQSI